MKYCRGDRVEVIGDRTDEGFVGSFFTAVISKVFTSGRYEVVYEELLADDGVTKERETLPSQRLRPWCTDDSTSKPLWQRMPGDAVDLWVGDGWWECYVVNTYDTHIDVHFPHPSGSSEDYEVYANPAKDPDLKHPEKRVRTGRDWDGEHSKWVARPRRLFGKGGKDFRSPARVARLKQEWRQQQQQEPGGGQEGLKVQLEKPGAQPSSVAPSPRSAARSPAFQHAAGASGGSLRQPGSASAKPGMVSPREGAMAGATAGGVFSESAAAAAAGWSTEGSEEEKPRQPQHTHYQAHHTQQQQQLGQRVHQSQQAQQQRSPRVALFGSSDEEDVPLEARFAHRAKRAEQAQQDAESDTSDGVADVPLLQRKQHQQLVAQQRRQQRDAQRRKGGGGEGGNGAPLRKAQEQQQGASHSAQAAPSWHTAHSRPLSSSAPPNQQQGMRQAPRGSQHQAPATAAAARAQQPLAVTHTSQRGQQQQQRVADGARGAGPAPAASAGTGGGAGVVELSGLTLRDLHPAAAAPALAGAKGAAVRADSAGALLGSDFLAFDLGGGTSSEGGMGSMLGLLDEEPPGEAAHESAQQAISNILHSFEGWDEEAAAQPFAGTGALAFLTSPPALGGRRGLPPASAGAGSAPGEACGYAPAGAPALDAAAGAMASAAALLGKAAGVPPEAGPAAVAPAPAQPVAAAAPAPAPPADHEPGTPSATADVADGEGDEGWESDAGGGGGRDRGGGPAPQPDKGESSLQKSSPSLQGATSSGKTQPVADAAPPPGGGPAGAKPRTQPAAKFTDAEKAVVLEVFRQWGRDYARLKAALPARDKRNLRNFVHNNMKLRLKLSQYITSDGKPLAPAPAAATAPEAKPKAQVQAPASAAAGIAAPEAKTRPQAPVAAAAAHAALEGQAKVAPAAGGGATAKVALTGGAVRAAGIGEARAVPGVAGGAAAAAAAAPGPAPVRCPVAAREANEFAAKAPAPAKITPQKRPVAAPPPPSLQAPVATAAAPRAAAPPGPATAGKSAPTNPPGAFIIPKRASTGVDVVTAAKQVAEERKKEKPKVAAPAPGDIALLGRKRSAGEEVALGRKHSAGEEVPAAAAKRQRTGAGAVERAQQAGVLPASAEPVPPDFPTVYCIDNIGGSITTEALDKALRGLEFKGIKRLRVVSVPLDQGQDYMAGYAVVKFGSREDAARELPRLQRVCMVTAACPIPRPFIVHAPRIACGCPWGEGNMPGHMRLPFTPSPHFAQTNSIEFDFALAWRKLIRMLQTAKESACQRHAQQVVDVFNQYQEEMRQASAEQGSHLAKDGISTQPGAAPPPPPPPPAPHPPAPAGGPRGKSRCLWLKDVAPPLDHPEAVRKLEEKIRTTFDQFGYPQRVELLRDPVTGRHSGHVVVWMETPVRVGLVGTNLREMVFLFNGTPRPLDADFAVPGPPRGSQSVYDRALRAVFGKDDNSLEGAVEFLELPDSRWRSAEASSEERAAIYLRRLMSNEQLQEMNQLKAVGTERAVQLANQQDEYYRRETVKLDRLATLQSMPVMAELTQLHGIRHRVYKHKGAADNRGRGRGRGR